MDIISIIVVTGGTVHEVTSFAVKTEEDREHVIHRAESKFLTACRTFYTASVEEMENALDVGCWEPHQDNSNSVNIVWSKV